MHRISVITPAIVMLLMLASSPATAGLFGEVGIAVGGVSPQGNFGTYADEGPTALIRASIHINQAPMFSGYLDLGGSLFSSQTEDVDVWIEGLGMYVAEKTVSQYNICLHAGLQLGSSTRRGAIRPRAVLAPGLYVFNTKTTVRMLDEDENFLDESDAQLKFGYRGILGSDFFFTTRWGISVAFVFDQVINLHHDHLYDQNGRLKQVSQSARFYSIMVGVVWPME